MVERGSGSVTGAALIGLVVTCLLGGLYGAATVIRVTGALRTAELAAVSIARRALAGDPTPCEPSVPIVIECEVDGVIASATIDREGTRATATAGPER